jgi:excisionase family DNA binding protein
MVKSRHVQSRTPGRPSSRSGLPEPIPGEPFSLLATLKRTRRCLSVQDAAEILGCSVKTIYKQIKLGKIPPADLGWDVITIDPKAWYDQLAHSNPHLASSARRAMK